METDKYLISIGTEDKKEQYKVTVQIDDNKKLFYYKEPDKTSTIYNYEKNILKRDNEQMSLEFEFKLNEKTNNSIHIKELNNIINVEIFTHKIEKTNNGLIVIYEMNDTKFIYQIEKES